MLSKIRLRKKLFYYYDYCNCRMNLCKVLFLWTICNFHFYFNPVINLSYKKLIHIHYLHVEYSYFNRTNAHLLNAFSSFRVSTNITKSWDPDNKYNTHTAYGTSENQPLLKSQQRPISEAHTVQNEYVHPCSTNDHT